MFDVQTASAVAAGEVVTPLPISFEGLHVLPGVETPSSQVTGAGLTTLVARHSGGRARLPYASREFGPAESTIVASANFLQAGQAVYAAGVAVQHRNAGALSIIWVLGTVAALADAVAPTTAEIKAALQLDDYAIIGHIGDLRFHRSADEVIDVAASNLRRPAYLDESRKIGILLDPADPSALGAEPAGYVDIPVDLTGYSAVTAGDLAVDGATLPSFPFGGRIDKLEFLTGQAGVAGDILLQAGIDGTEVTGSDLQLTAANTALGGAPPSSTPTAARDFKPGQGLDIEVDTVTSAFTAGTGTLRVHVSKYTAG